MSQTIKLPRLHSAQQQIVNKATRFNVLATGRRFGKTTLGIDRLLRHALNGKPVGWFAPTYRHLMAMWRELVEILGDVGDANRNDKFIQLPGRGSFEAWSLDTPSPARSRKYAAIVIDEAGHAVDLKAQWDNAIRPTLTDFRGEAWFLSSPNGLNFFHQLWQRGNDPEREDWASWQMPTAANPYIAADEIESARIDMGELAFRQEYLAEFVSWEGAVFRRIGNCLWSPPEELKQQQRVEPWHTWQRTAAIGCDWGRTNDYTVFTVATDDPFRPTGAGDLRADNHPANADNWNSTSVVEVDRFRGVEFAMQRSRLFALWERYGRLRCVCPAGRCREGETLMRIVCLRYEMVTVDPQTGRAEIDCDFMLSETGVVVTARLFDIPHETEPKDLGIWLAGGRRIGMKLPPGVSLNEFAEKAFLATAFAAFLAIAKQALNQTPKPPEVALPSYWVN